jgi:ParB family chromosome partitioning protein
MARVKLSAISTADTEDKPGASATVLVHLRVDTIAATPVNSRRNFGTPAELKELGESMRVRQLQPVVVVPRAAYLALWPDHADRIGTAAHILANGERRLRAAHIVRLETIEAIIREDIADGRTAFLDAVFTENIQRRNFDPIEEAQAVDALVAEFGTSQAVADHYGKSPGWVTQRRILLKLTRELQDLVSARKIPLAAAREIGKLPRELQGEAWRDGSWSRTEPMLRPVPENPAFTAVKPDPGPSEPGPAAATTHPAQDAQTFTAVKVQADTETADTAPEPTTAAVTTEPTPSAETFTAVKVDATEAADPEAPPAAEDGPAPATSSVPEQREPEQERDVAAVKDWEDLAHVSDVIIGAMEPRRVYQLLEMVADRLKAIGAAI